MLKIVILSVIITTVKVEKMYKKKFNVFIFSTLIMIALVGGVFSAYKKGSEIVNAIEEEIIIGEDETATQEDNDLPDGMTVLPSDATAYERLEYGFKILSDGVGYTSYSAQVITVVGQVQNFAIKRYRGNNYDLTEEYYRYDGIMSVGKNEFASYYSDGVNLKSKRSHDKSKYNFASKSYDYTIANDDIKSSTVVEWEKEQLKINSFFTTIDKNNSRIISYDNKGRDKDYYTIKLYLDPDKLDEKFVNLFASNGISNLKINSIYIEFKIDKTTGYFLSYSANADLQATWGITAQVQFDMKETYLTMNSSAESIIKNIANKSFGIEY